MEYTNRLQFVHCEQLFNTSDEAKAYVNENIKIERPSLYGEPMVLKYGKEDEPNLILAIASVGEGKPSMDNKVFFIDFAKAEEDIKDIVESVGNNSEAIDNIQEVLSQLINSCGLAEEGKYESVADDAILKNAKSLYEADKLLSDYIKKVEAKTSIEVEGSDALKLEVESDENGSVISGDVIVAPNKIVDNKVISNIILKESNGLFTNVNLDYNSNGNLVFGVNGIEKEFEMPKDTYVVEGKYDTKTESLILMLNREADIKDANGNTVKGNKIRIDLTNLIGEWTVDGENSETPIMLFKEAVTSNEVLHGRETWQDVLKADVRIASKEQVPTNILKKDATGRYLYVEGNASNITYWKNGEKKTVKEALDNLEISVSKDSENIISNNESGLFASVKLDYSNETNELTFITSKQDGSQAKKTIKLNGLEFFDKIYYDSQTEEIVILYHSSAQGFKELRIPVGTLITEWEVDNSAKTVTLTKTRVVNGTDKLSANVNINTNAKNNILEVQGDALYVRGEADNIMFSGNTSVFEEILKIEGDESISGSFKAMLKDEIEARKEGDALLQDNLTKEIERAKSEEARIEDRIDEHNTSVDTAIATLTNSLNAEIKRSQTADEHIVSELNNVSVNVEKEAERALKAETELSNRIDTNAASIVEETSRAKGEEARIEGALNVLVEHVGTSEKAITESINANTEAIKKESDRAQVEEAKIKEEIKSANDNLSTINADLTNLNTKVETNAQAIEAEKAERKDHDVKIGEAIRETNSRVDTVTTDLASASEKIEKNASDIVKEQERAEGVEKQLGYALQNAVNDLNTVKTTVTSVSEKTEANIVKLGELNTSVETVKSDVVELQKKVESSSTDVSALKEKVEKNANDIATNASKIADNAANITANSTKIDANATKIEEVNNSFKTETQNIWAKVNENANKIGENTSNIASVWTKLQEHITSSTEAHNELKTKVGTLESGLADANVKITEVKSATEANNQLIVSESNRAKAVEDLISANTSSNTEAINTERDRALEAEAVLRQSIVDAEKNAQFTTENTQSLTLEKTVGADGITVLKGHVNVSSAVGNLINNDGGALYANVDLTYNEGTHTLTFETSGGETKDIKLNFTAVIDAITYDSVSEMLTIHYTNNEGKQEVSFSVRTLFSQLDVQKDHLGGIILTKTVGQGGDADVLSAKVVITEDTDNLLKNDNGVLKVSNSAQNIILNDNNTNVQERIVGVENSLRQEIADRTTADATIQGKLDAISGQTGESTQKLETLENTVKDHETRIETVESKVTELSGKVETHTTQLTELNTKVDTISGNVETVKADIVTINNNINSINTEIGKINDKNAEQDEAITNIQNELNDRIKIDAIGETETIKLSIVDADTDTPTLKGVVKVSASEGNIIKTNFDGMYATVTMSYEASANTITFNNGNSTQSFSLISGSSIKEFVYDKTSNSLVLTYINENGQEATLEIPLTELVKFYTYDNAQGNVVFDVDDTNRTIRADVSEYDCGTF